MAWPLLVKLGLGAGAAWWATSCSWKDGLAKYKRNKDAFTNLDKVGAVAVNDGKVPANHTLITRVNTFATSFKELGALVEAMDQINPLGIPNMSACALIKRCEEDSAQLSALGAELASVAGIANPVPTPPVPKEFTVKDAVTLGAYSIGGYYLLKTIMMLFKDQGETIPRAQLPQYAGGTRKNPCRRRA